MNLESPTYQIEANTQITYVKLPVDDVNEYVLDTVTILSDIPLNGVCTLSITNANLSVAETMDFSLIEVVYEKELTKDISVDLFADSTNESFLYECVIDCSSDNAIIKNPHITIIPVFCRMGGNEVESTPIKFELQLTPVDV